jgi:hypothetical protein
MASILDKEISALIDLCIKINEIKQARNIGLSKKVNPAIVSLNKYSKVFQRTEADEHKPFIHTVYNKFKKEILKNETDKWLRTNQVYIQYGDNITNAGDFEKVKSIRIYLSIFYLDAIKIKDEVEDELQGLPPNARNSRNELLYPDYFMLRVYRIFRESIDIKKDRDTLARHVKSIESDLGIEHDEQPDQTASGTFGNGDGLSNILNVLTKSMGNIKLPETSKSEKVEDIKSEDIGKMVNQVLSNPKIGNTINNIVSDFQNCSSMDQMLGKLMSKLNDPSLTEAITSTFTGTAEGALKTTDIKETEDDNHEHQE